MTREPLDPERRRKLVIFFVLVYLAGLPFLGLQLFFTLDHHSLAAAVAGAAFVCSLAGIFWWARRNGIDVGFSPRRWFRHR